MRKIMLSLLFTLSATLTLTAQEANVYFAFNSHIIRINDIGKLDQLVEQYRQQPFPLLLVGHTDTVGGQHYNDGLSARRVNSIKAYLQKNGIRSTDIHTEYYGEAKVAGHNQFFNRRVEVFRNRTTKAPVFKSYEDFITHISPRSEAFDIPSNEPVDIEGKKGTLLSIPANAFVYRNGQAVKGPVRIELTEYYSMQDFISQRLSTISNGNVLTSGGMIDLKARQDTSEIFLKDGAEISLAFPRSSKEAYFTFYGERQPDGRMNWLLDKELWEKKQHDIGVIPTADGKDLITTDKRTADATNKLIIFDRQSNSFKQLTPEEKKAFDLARAKRAKELEVHYEEQRKILAAQWEYYEFLSTRRLGLINCDEFIRDAKVLHYYVAVQDSGMQLMNAYLLFRGSRALLELRKYKTDQFEINARLPMNRKVDLLVTAMRGDKLFVFFDKVELDDKTEAITLKESSFVELGKILKDQNPSKDALQ
jgi:hypothetical protein